MKLYTKYFKNKNSMNSYFRKVRQNDKIAECWCGLDAKTGWTIWYNYKKN